MNNFMKETAAIATVSALACIPLVLIGKPITSDIELTQTSYLPTYEIKRIVHTPIPKFDTDWCIGHKDCYKIAEAVYHEARSDGYAGMQAVANVIMNRSATRNKTPYDIITENRQFSYLHTIKNLEMNDIKSKRIAVDIALSAMIGELPDITHGSTFYYSTKILKSNPPYWVTSVTYVKDIKNHRFYK